MHKKKTARNQKAIPLRQTPTTHVCLSVICNEAAPQHSFQGSRETEVTLWHDTNTQPAYTLCVDAPHSILSQVCFI